jgi:hypothetical protein
MRKDESTTEHFGIDVCFLSGILFPQKRRHRQKSPSMTLVQFHSNDARIDDGKALFNEDVPYVRWIEHQDE